VRLERAAALGVETAAAESREVLFWRTVTLE
jgi:hypothetical protein